MPTKSSTSKSATTPLVVDVRPIFAKGGSPCNLIDESVAGLEPGQVFVLLVPFEPVPLYARLARAGYSHTAEKLSDGTWRIEFNKTSDPASTGPDRFSKTTPPPGGRETLLDNRGLEPPEPMVRTLEAVDRLAADGKINMLSDRKPLHLFRELEVILTPDWITRRVRVPLGLQKLAVFRPSTLELILTKMARSDENNLADIQYLLRQEEISSEQLRAAFARARVPDVPEIGVLFLAAQAKVLALVEKH